MVLFPKILVKLYVNKTAVSCILITPLSNPCDSKTLGVFYEIFFLTVLNLDTINTISVKYLQAVCSKFELLDSSEV